MRTFLLDENNDLTLNREGNLAMISGIEAAAQTSRNFASTKLGEMIHSVDQGIPFFMTSFDRFPNLDQFEAALRRRLLQLDTVQSITSLNIQYLEGAVNYQVTLQTTYGEVEING